MNHRSIVRALTLVSCLMFSGAILKTQVSGSTVLAQDRGQNRRDNKALPQGKVVLKGQEGDYLAQVIAVGNLDTAWQVLTDYENFPRFLPNISSCKIIKTEANRVLFEQVNVVDLWLFKEEFTVQIAAVKTKPSRVDFKLAEGELKKLVGSWQIEEMAPGKILVSHRVEVEPGSNTEKPFFYGVYETSLEETLKAIAIEIQRRSQL